MLRANSNRFPRIVSAVCVLFIFLSGCRQSTLVHSPRASSRNGYRPASPGTLSSYIRTVLKISAEKGPRVEQELRLAQEQNPNLVKQAEDSSAHPADLAAGLQVAESYMKAGLYYPAYEVYQRLEAASGPDVGIELGLADIWDKWQDYSLAQHYAEAAVNLDPQSAKGWNLLGKIQLHRSDFVSAAVSFEKALSLQTSDPVLFANAGYAFLRIDQTEKAQAYLEKALSMDGTIVEAHNHLGIVLARLGRCDAALTHFTQTCEPAVALNNLGTVLLEQGKRDEARKYFQQAIALRPDYEKARAHLGEVDYPEAPPSRVSLASVSATVVAEAPAALPANTPPASEPITHPHRVSVSIAPVTLQQGPAVQAKVDAVSIDVPKATEPDDIVIGKDAYRVTKQASDDEPQTAVSRPVALYQPGVPSPLQSVVELAIDFDIPKEDLLPQAFPPGTGSAGPGAGRSGADPKVTALRWQEPLLNPVALADVSIGWSTSPHSDRADRFYVPSGVNLLFSGLLALGVVIGLLLAGSFRAVVGISLILAGVAASLMAL